MRNWILIVFLSAYASSFAKDIKYPVSAIPEELKKDAHVVVRDDRMTYTVISRSEGKLEAYFAVTIFNENGKHYAKRYFDYSKLEKISYLHAAVYDANGQLVKKLKQSEIYDQSAYDGVTMYSDNRFKAFDLGQGFYPYTIEFEYEKVYKYLFQIDGSYIQSGERTSVQNASYELIYPPSLKPRYKSYNIDSEPIKSTREGGLESLKWTFTNLPAFIHEPYAPAMSMAKYIMAAPAEFEFDRYQGNMSSWENFGKWVGTLNKDRNQLPEPTIQKLKEITAKATSTEEKIKLVYEYMQNKTRYVSIQLGIGGYQPFEAVSVDQTGYGDCKALSNYMVSMLQQLGIKSHYALIRAGKNAPVMDVDFPSSQFNHAVVAVPMEKDTIWLECTSQTNPFGYIGSFTGDRKALIITDNGAAVVNTTPYPAEKNIQSRSAKVTLDASGNARAKVRTVYSGLQYENDNLLFILNNNLDDQKKWIENNTEIPAFNLLSFSMTNQKEKVPSATVTTELDLAKYASVSGKRVFLVPNLMNRFSMIPEKVTDRKTDVVARHTYIDYDTIQFTVPENLYPESLPAPVKISTRFGQYESSYKLDQGSLIYTRKLKVEKGRFPADSYNEMIEFYKGITKADNTKVVFLSKT